MRKLLLTLVLPLLLLVGQHGRAWHEVQHLSQAAPTSKGGAGDKSQPADKLCQSCLAFAQLGAAAASQPPALLLDGPSRQGVQALQLRVIAGAAPAPRSRGPPFFH